MTPLKTYRRYQRNQSFLKVTAKTGALTVLAPAENDAQMARDALFLALQNTEIAKARATCAAMRIVNKLISL